MENNKKQKDELAQYGIIRGKLLKTVVIHGKKPDEPNLSNNLVSPEFADQVIHADEMAKGGPFSVRIEGALHGVHIQRGSATIGAYPYLTNETTRPMRVILDGVDTDGDLDEITGLAIASIEVLRSPGSTGAYSGFALTTGVYRSGYEGILLINTNRHAGLQSRDIVSIGVLPIAPKGFYKAREFYSPRYDHPSPTNNRADLRTTIFWKPDLDTDKDGNASFEYHNADGTGNYKVIIEGIDKNGNIGRQVYRYKVE